MLFQFPLFLLLTYFTYGSPVPRPEPNPVSNSTEDQSSVKPSQSSSPTCQRRSIDIHSLNHITRETRNVSRLTDFYVNILGFSVCTRPMLDLNGAWLYIPNNFFPEHHQLAMCRAGCLPPASISLHIIEAAQDDQERNERKPENSVQHINRHDHTALKVMDIAQAEQVLIDNEIPYHKTVLPGTSNVQLFFYDPDMNAIEICDCDNEILTIL